MFDAIMKTAFLSGFAKPDTWLIDWIHTGTETASGERITEETAMSCAAVKAVVAVLSETVASLPLDVYRKTPGGGREAAVDHPVQRLLHDEPNPETSSYIWRETNQGHICLWGNCYAIVERTGGGRVIGLWQRSAKPERTKPFRNPNDGKLWYELHDEFGAKEDDIPARDMLHIPGFGFDGLVGYSPIKWLAETVGCNKASERYAAELFANDAAQRGHYEHPSQLSEPAYKRLQESINQQSQHGGRHKTRILEEGMKFASNSMNPEDVQMIEARRFGIEEIARAFRVSPHLLQDLTHGTFSNITELGRQFIVFTMMPWLKRWEGEINRKLLAPPYYCKFNAAAFMQGDHVARATYYRALWGIGGITINQILAKEDENGIGPEGDVRFVPLNMVPLDVAIKGPREPAEPKTPEEGGGGAETGPADPQNESAKAGPALRAAEAVLRDALLRMARIEANAANRAAKDPATFISAVENFLAKHAATFREAVALPLRAVLAAGGIWKSEDQLVEDHINGLRARLLSAAECKASELSVRVAGCWAK